MTVWRFVVVVALVVAAEVMICALAVREFRCGRRAWGVLWALLAAGWGWTVVAGVRALAQRIAG